MEYSSQWSEPIIGRNALRNVTQPPDWHHNDEVTMTTLVSPDKSSISHHLLPTIIQRQQLYWFSWIDLSIYERIMYIFI